MLSSCVLLVVSVQQLYSNCARKVDYTLSHSDRSGHTGGRAHRQATRKSESVVNSPTQEPWGAAVCAISHFIMRQVTLGGPSKSPFMC